MGLSSSHQNLKGDVLKEVISAMKEALILIGNPTSAKKTIIELVGLSETEAKKAQEARDYIARYDALCVEMNKREAAADVILEESKRIKKEALDQHTVNEINQKSLKAYEISLENIAFRHKEKEAAHVSKDRSHLNERTELDATRAKLASLEASISDKHNAVLELENKLKDKAKRLKAEADNF